jgi:hypothetical protein
LRARSIGEIVETKYKCENKVGDVPCGALLDVSIRLLDVKVQNLELSNDVIKVTKDITLKLKYPEFSILQQLQSKSKTSGVDNLFGLIASCVEYISDGDNFWYAHETPQEEIILFLERLDTKQFAEVEKFFDTLPYVEEIINIKCPKCGFDHQIKIRGLDNFFE